MTKQIVEVGQWLAPSVCKDGTLLVLYTPVAVLSQEDNPTGPSRQRDVYYGILTFINRGVRCNVPGYQCCSYKEAEMRYVEAALIIVTAGGFEHALADPGVPINLVSNSNSNFTPKAKPDAEWGWLGRAV